MLNAGAPPPEEWRKELAKGIAEIESLQGIWLRTLKAVQATETDREQKRRVRSAATLAQM